VRHALIPKGAAMALHLTKEFNDGVLDAQAQIKNRNPFDFFDEYEKYYAYDIGYQIGKQ